MRTIAVIADKGGCGKTTLAIHVATAAVQAGISTVIVDTVPLACATAWARRRRGRQPYVQPCVAPAALQQRLKEIEAAGIMLAIIDTSRDEAMTCEAARSADLIVVPCIPNSMDVWTLPRTAELIRTRHCPAYVVFMRTPVGKIWAYADEATTVERLGLRVAPHRLSKWADFSNSFDTGETAQEVAPDGRAATDMRFLWEWLELDSELWAGVEGRPMCHTERSVPFATRIAPKWYEEIRRIAARDNVMVVEVLEEAVAAYKSAGMKPRRRKKLASLAA